MATQLLLRGVQGMVRWPECYDFLHNLIMNNILYVVYFEGKCSIYGDHI